MKNVLLINLFLLIFVSCSGGRNSTGYSIINDMMYSITYEAYSESSIHENGQSMQAPPANTIARGKMPHPMLADGTPEILNNSVVMDDYRWKRAELLFNRTCSACHGVDGQATGKVVTEGGFPAPPKFKSRRFKYSKKDNYHSGNIYNVITFGIGNMPSHAQQLYGEDRWLVSEYVREKLMTKGKK